MENVKKRNYKKNLNNVITRDSVSVNRSDLYNLLQRPVITEKTTFVSEIGKLVFDVSVKSTKKEIADAVASIYGVGVVSVNTLIRKGKSKRFKGINGVRSNIKRAYVTLKAGTNIDVFSDIK